MPYSAAESAGSCAEARTITYAGSYCAGSSAAPASPLSSPASLPQLSATAAASRPSIWRIESKSSALSPRGRVGLRGVLSASNSDVGPRDTGGAGGGLHRSNSNVGPRETGGGLRSDHSMLGPADGGGGGGGGGAAAAAAAAAAAGLGPPSQCGTHAQLSALVRAASASAAACFRPRKPPSRAASAWACCVLARAGARTSVR